MPEYRSHEEIKAGVSPWMEIKLAVTKLELAVRADNPAGVWLARNALYRVIQDYAETKDGPENPRPE